MTLKALIFDVDGTLAETEDSGHRCAFNAAFDELGLGWHWNMDLYSELLAVGGGRERIEAYMRYYVEHLPDNPRELVDRLHALKAVKYVELMERGDIPLRTGIFRMIAKEAREAGLILAVATNSSGISLSSLIQRYFAKNPDELFDVVVCGDELDRKKPHPEAYQRALKKLDLNAEDCLAFEDSHVGLKAALKTGIATVVTVSKFTHHEDFSGASLVVSQLGDPGEPTEILANPHGVLLDAEFVTVEMLQKLHAATQKTA